MKLGSIGFVLVLLAAIALLPTRVLADNPNFHYADSSVSSTTGALSVAFKETGLGTTLTTEQVTLSVELATAEYQCWNKGGKHPQAGNKETVSESLTTTGNFPVRNGQTTGTISAGPPSEGDFACPGGQQLYLMSVVYSGITVTGSGGDSLEADPDPIGIGPVKIPID